MRKPAGTLTPRRLRLALALFFIALAVPSGVLVQQAFSRLRLEAFHQQRVLAEELAAGIRTRAAELAGVEEARSFAEYEFLVVAGDPASGYLQRSPLAEYPPRAALPGTLGHFQIDPDGAFSTPLLPAPGTDADAFGVSAEELALRQGTGRRIRTILASNRLVGAPAAAARAAGVTAPATVAGALPGARAGAPPGRAPARAPHAAEEERQVRLAPQAAFDQLSRTAPDLTTGSLREDAAGTAHEAERLQQPARPANEQDAPATPATQATPSRRKEIRALADPAPPAAAAGFALGALPGMTPAERRVRTFEGAVDPFELSRLDSGHFVLFRRVWRDGRRFIQGLLIDPRPFVDALVLKPFRVSALAPGARLELLHRGALIGAGARARDAAETGADHGEALYRTALAAPLADLELVFTTPAPGPGPGARVVTWVALALAAIGGGGLLLMYRLGSAQIRLARQQQDFVAAVSHELRTPLTSIRMYAEMLSQGWAPPDKQREYYRYIHDESERLSRLIGNVLQLARMTRDELEVRLEAVRAAELIDTVRSKIASAVEAAGFSLQVHCRAPAADATVLADRDCFAQIIINLVDNALKFAAGAPQPRIDLGCREADGRILFTVRDYGPGIPSADLERIFVLFQRAADAHTRGIAGTGIGLALVQRLAAAMDATITAVNAEPGAELRLAVPRA